MKIRKFRLFCLWSPIWLGIAMAVLIAGCGYFIRPLLPNLDCPEWIKMICVMPPVALVFGGLQYIAALCIFFRFANIEYTKSYLVGLTFLPLYFAILQVFGILVVLAAIGDLDFEDGTSILFFLPINLAVGYTYVAAWVVAEAAVAIFRRVRAA